MFFILKGEVLSVKYYVLHDWSKCRIGGMGVWGVDGGFLLCDDGGGEIGTFEM